MGAAQDGEMREGIQVQVSAKIEHTACRLELILCGQLGCSSTSRVLTWCAQIPRFDPPYCINQA